MLLKVFFCVIFFVLVMVSSSLKLYMSYWVTVSFYKINNNFQNILPVVLYGSDNVMIPETWNFTLNVNSWFSKTQRKSGQGLCLVGEVTYSSCPLYSFTLFSMYLGLFCRHSAALVLRKYLMDFWEHLDHCTPLRNKYIHHLFYIY